MCWSSGRAYGPPRRASCPSRSQSLVCKIPIALLGLSETNTISFELEGMDSVHEISIASQRGNGLGGVTVDGAGDVLPEGSETRPDAGIQDVNTAFEVLPQAFDRIE